MSAVRTRTLGLTLQITNVMRYRSGTALGGVIGQLQATINVYNEMNLTGQVAAAGVGSSLMAILTALVQLDKQQLADAGANASYIAGLQQSYTNQIAALQSQLQGQARVAATPTSAPSAPAPNTSTSASAPAPAAASTPTTAPTGTYVSLPAAGAMTGGGFALGGILGWMFGKRSQEAHHGQHARHR